MAFISAAVGAVTAWVGALTWSAVGAFALKTAASMGLSALAQKLSGKKGPQKQPFGVKTQLERGADVPQSFILGRYATAGSLIYTNTRQWAKTPNEELVLVITLSDLPVTKILGIWVNDIFRHVEITSVAERTDVPGFTRNFGSHGPRSYMDATFYDGRQTAPDPWVGQQFSTPERPWDGSAIGHGKAYMVMRATIQEQLFRNGIPKFLFEVEGIPLYSPAQDSSVGGSGLQRWGNPATWRPSDNPAVQLYNILRGIRYQGDWVYGLQDVTAAQLPAAHWIAQINKCDTLIEGASGMERMYRSSAEIPINAEIHAVIESLLDACAGRLSDAGGVYKLFAGAPDAPVMSFTDADILSTSEQSFTPFLGLSDTVNGVVAKYPSPGAVWQVETAPPLYRPDYEAEDGGRRLLVDISLDFVPYPEQAQRLMQAALNEARRARRHTLTLPPAYWVLEPGDAIAWTSERNGYVAKQFRADGVIDLPNGDVMLDLTEVDPSDYAWDTVTDFTPSALPSVIAQPIPVQVVQDFAVQASSVEDAAGEGRRPAIRATWDGDVADVTALKIEYRVKARGLSPHETRVDTVDLGQIYIVSGVLPATEYEVRGKFIASSPRDTLWTEWLEVATLDIRVQEKDLSTIIRDKITDAGDTADAAADAARDADTKAGQVRADHDALVDGFIGNLADGFAGLRDYADTGDQGIQTQLDLIAMSISNSSYIRKTDGDDLNRGGWVGLAGATIPNAGGTSMPPGQTGRNIQIFPGGAKEGPYYSGRSIKGTTFRHRGWVGCLGGATVRVAIVGSLAGAGPGGESILAQSEPLTGAWQNTDLQFTVDVDTDEWAPAYIVTGPGSAVIWRVRLEDYSAAASLEASIQANYALIQGESDARALADTNIIAAYKSADATTLATVRSETYTRAAADSAMVAQADSMRVSMEGAGGSVRSHLHPATALDFRLTIFGGGKGDPGQSVTIHEFTDEAAAEAFAATATATQITVLK